jgi:hypothetical protein
MAKKQGIGHQRKKTYVDTRKLPPSTNTAINHEILLVDIPPVVMLDNNIDEAEESIPTVSNYLTIKDNPVPVLDEKARRLAIAYLFQVHVLLLVAIIVSLQK